MEITIVNLEYTDQATKQMLQKVVERKKKYDSLHLKHLIVMWAFILISFFYVYYVYRTVIIPYQYSFAEIFSSYVGNSFHLYALIVVGGLFGFMNLLREKRDKAETEFHALRCEIIDKSTDLWKDKEAWENRHKVFEIMKKEYDINLYHENK